ncbi:carbohydrate porin [Cerasicoccus arenae]|uniref:Porin n=1 Tax=Cerasicoccus arenae TaxID=424488 RepID=A0A8J3DEA3_9BACT|nr:carbohydrate porin [Cerasicoccus arenae]MBK1858280.1 carbohydrate porin [Cerasicoccus arenae]GHB90498.1 porin [Cerasicoccus arenae]
MAFFICSALLATPGSNADPAYDELRLTNDAFGEDWMKAEGATGSWGGLRPQLEDHGLSPFASATGQFLANVDGGYDDDSAWEILIDFGLEVDLEKLVGWTGGAFFINAFYFHGNDLSGNGIGDFNGVSNIYTGTDVNVFNLYASQSLFEGRLYLKAGQIAADDDFMAADTALIFINSCFGPILTESGNIAAPIYPLAAPGALVNYEPFEGWQVLGAVYAGDAGPNQPSNHGFEWRTGGSAGWAWFGETGVDYNLLGHGIFKLGGFYATGDFTNFSTGGTEDGLGAVYGIIDHQLLDPKGDPLGLSLFCRGSFSPDESLATVTAFVDGGFSLQSIFIASDAFGVAASHAWFGNDYRNASLLGGTPVTASETVVEVTYTADLTSWLSMQPDLQYIINPHYSESDALIIGIRCAMNL